MKLEDATRFVIFSDMGVGGRIRPPERVVWGGVECRPLALLILRSDSGRLTSHK